MRNSLPDLMYQIEKTIVENALVMTGGNCTYSSELLRINRTTLNNMIHRLNINRQKLIDEHLSKILIENREIQRIKAQENEELKKIKSLGIEELFKVENNNPLTLKEISKKYAQVLLDKNLGNMSKTAVDLGISRNTLQRLINKKKRKRLNL